MKQIWHLPLQHSDVSWKSLDNKGEQISPQKEEGLVSELFGKKDPCEIILFQTSNDSIITNFEIEPLIDRFISIAYENIIITSVFFRRG